MRRTRALLPLLLLALAAGACSLRFATPPPPPSEWPRAGHTDVQRERCTASVVPPLVDTAATGALATAALLDRDVHATWVPIVLGVAALGPAISAVYGYIVTAECRHYERQFETLAPTTTPPPPLTP
jgi:hypothetical protein